MLFWHACLLATGSSPVFTPTYTIDMNNYPYRTKEKIKRRKKQTVLAGLLCLLIVLLDQNTRTHPYLHRYIAHLISPIYIWVDAPSHAMHTWYTYWTEQEQLLKENRQLHAQNHLLKAKIYALSHRKQEDQQTQQWMQQLQRARIPISRFLNARLLAISLSPFHHTMLVDQGEREGAFVGQPVLDGEGIIGHISHVNPHSSRVLLASDAAFAIPVTLQRTEQRAIAVGTGETGYAQLREVPADSTIAIGDIAVSSGLGSRYPAGYPVGRVVDIQHNAQALFAAVRIKLSSHADKGAHVLLVWPEKKQP